MIFKPINASYNSEFPYQKFVQIGKPITKIVRSLGFVPFDLNIYKHTIKNRYEISHNDRYEILNEWILDFVRKLIENNPEYAKYIILYENDNPNLKIESKYSISFASSSAYNYFDKLLHLNSFAYEYRPRKFTHPISYLIGMSGSDSLSRNIEAIRKQFDLDDDDISKEEIVFYGLKYPDGSGGDLRDGIFYGMSVPYILFISFTNKAYMKFKLMNQGVK